MSYLRTISRIPRVIQITKAVPSSTRTMSYYPSVLTRFPQSSSGNDLFRILDDFMSTRPYDFPTTQQAHQSHRSQVFQPRFDIKELKDHYELRGELPGVEQKDVEVQFTDDQTITISGRTHRESHTEKALDHGHQQKQIEGTSNGTSSHHDYHKPSVEDEAVQSASAAKSSSNTAVAKTPSSDKSSQVAHHNQTAPSRYWVSERFFGEFHRTFSFPSRVNQNEVKASLKNGILNITVPKATAPGSKKINIESLD